MLVHIGQKITITLSESSFARIEYDLFSFKIKMSKLIERVVIAFCRDSARLMDLERGEGRERILQDLLADNDYLFRKTIVSLCVRGKGTIKRNSFNEKTERYSWTITKDACKALCNDSRTQGETPIFISELLNEYVGMSFAQKEKIILAEAIEEIERAIKNNKPFEYISGGGYASVMHPSCIEIDPNLHYMYVLGHAVPLDKYDPKTFEPNLENVSNIRIFNLRYDNKIKSWIKILYKETAKTDEKAIAQRLLYLSPGFIGEKVYEIKVEMNEKGESLYKTIIHNRPQYVSKSLDYVDGFREYTFKCTLFQAAIYFMNFEDRARIVSPVEAVEAIKNRIEKIYQMYF